MKKKIFRAMAILLILVLVMTGCAKTEETQRTTDDRTDVTNGVAGSADEGGSSSGSDKGDARDEGGSGVLDLFGSVFTAAEAKGSASDDGSTGYFISDAAVPSAKYDSYSDYDYSEAMRDYAGGEYERSGGSYDEDGVPCDPVVIRPSAGILTAGEWNDNLHYDFFKNLINNGQEREYSQMLTRWKLTPFSRLAIHVSDITTDVESARTEGVSGSAIYTDGLQNARVTVFNSDGAQIWQSKTDNKGMTYVYYRLNGGQDIPSAVKVEYNGVESTTSVENADLLDNAVMDIRLNCTEDNTKKLDLMFVIDTTGSMGDEIVYLQKELEDVIERVEKQNANIPVRLSCNFYRDLGDEYVVRTNEFTTDINNMLSILNSEYADGGGDYEEAVEMALEDAVNNHSWNESSTKLMFLVLDAPPHNTDQIADSLAKTLNDAIAKGIRIIPIASSGIDKETEFLLRAFAMTTGGTYTFLTDDSGVGNGHIEPTVGQYDVEYLNDMLVRIISDYIY